MIALKLISLAPPGSSGNRRFVAAVCASLLLHALLLASYDWRAGAESGFPESLSSWRLDVRLRLPPSRPLEEDQPELDEDQTGHGPPLPARAVREPYDATGSSASSASKAEHSAPAAASNEKATVPESPPPIDIDDVRRFARRMAAAESRHPTLQARVQVQMNGERETPLGQAIAKAVRPDCRSAYAGAGLFAIPLLIKDAMTNSGCRW